MHGFTPRRGDMHLLLKPAWRIHGEFWNCVGPYSLVRQPARRVEGIQRPRPSSLHANPPHVAASPSPEVGSCHAIPSHASACIGAIKQGSSVGLTLVPPLCSHSSLHVRIEQQLPALLPSLPLLPPQLTACLCITSSTAAAVAARMRDPRPPRPLLRPSPPVRRRGWSFRFGARPRSTGGLGQT